MKKLRRLLTVFFRSVRLLFLTDAPRALALTLLVPLQGLLPVLTAFATSRILDALSVGSDTLWTALLSLAAFWGALHLLDGVLNPLVMQLQGSFTDLLIHRVNHLVFDKSLSIEDLSTAESAEYFDSVQVIQDEVAWRPINLIIFTLSVLRAAVMVIAIVISLCAFHPLIALALLLSLLPQSVVLYRLQQEAFENMVNRSPLSRHLRYDTDVLLSKEYAKELRLFRYGPFFLKRYDDTFSTIFRDSNAVRRKKTLSSALLFALGALISTLALVYILRGALAGRFSVGDVSLFASYIILASQTLITMIQEGALLYDTLLFMEKLFRFTDQPLSMRSGKRRLDSGGIESVEFRDVSFTYPDAAQRALCHVSFSLSKGEHAALVGENGSGKSTVVKLLCRFYDVSEGEILINGHDIREYDIPSLRAQICAVFQDFCRYDMTVEENVRIADIAGARDPREKDVERALESADASFVSRLKGGVDQLLGRRFSGGADLSGGEWQKLSIARAFYARGSLVLFDEPSSALDARSETHFWQSALSLSQGRTALYITHRLSGITFADKILVLDHGALIEQGTHQSLMAAKGTYHTLYQMQAQRYGVSENESLCV